MNQKPVYLLDLDYEGVKATVISLGEKAYRADQLAQWIFNKSAISIDEMSDLPVEFRVRLKENSVLLTLRPLEDRTSADGATRKILFQLEDGQTLESTLMFYENSNSHRERRTVCVSTQVGCPMDCYFCATGQQGFVRNLRPGEILEQVLHFEHYIKKKLTGEDREATRKYVTNVVLMGMGEPLANYDNVRKAVLTLNSKHGLGLGARQITLSTCGLVPQLRQLAGENLHLELAISLHAATDELRNRLMPVNRKYPLSELIPACVYYFEKTGRRPTFEYALFEGVNDSPQNAREVAVLLKGINCSVNIIVGNPTGSSQFKSSSLEQARIFQKHLFTGGIFNTIRVSKGKDIEAGCGQLRSRYLSQEPEEGRINALEKRC